jgi:hypothetical protein
MEERRSAYKWVNLKEGCHMEDLKIDGRMRLNGCYTNRYRGRGLDCSGSR